MPTIVRGKGGVVTTPKPNTSKNVVVKKPAQSVQKVVKSKPQQPVIQQPVNATNKPLKNRHVVSSPKKVAEVQKPVETPVKQPEIEVPKVEEVKEEVKETVAPQGEIKESIDNDFGAILKPITRKKVRYEEGLEAPIIKEPESQVYTLDQKGVELLVNTIVDSLEDRFVTKTNVQHIVERTLQKMMIDNDLNS